MNIKKDILETIGYFSNFAYPPDFDEIYVFLRKKTSKNALKMAILSLERQNRIIVIQNPKFRINNATRYTLPEYSTIRHPSSAIKQLDNYELRITDYGLESLWERNTLSVFFFIK